MTGKHLFTRRQMLLLGLGSFIGPSTPMIREALIREPRNREWQNYQGRNFIAHKDVSLGNRAATKGLLYGAAIRQSALFSDRDYA